MTYWMIFDTISGNAIDIVYDFLIAEQWKKENDVVVIAYDEGGEIMAEENDNKEVESEEDSNEPADDVKGNAPSFDVDEDVEGKPDDKITRGDTNAPG